MIILNLNKYEIYTLSSFSKIEINKNSPFYARSFKEFLKFDDKNYIEAYDSFMDNGFLVRKGDEVNVAQELEPAFLIFHRPDVMVSFKRLSNLNVINEYFCFKKDFALHYTVANGGLLHGLEYPHVLPSVGNWIRKDLFVGNKFEKEELFRYSIEITFDETILLYIIMTILKDRITNRNEGLENDELIIKLDDLVNYENFDDLVGFISDYMSKEELKIYVKNNPNFLKSIDTLKLKNIIQFNNDEIILSEYAKKIFDPGKIIDSIIITEKADNSLNVASVNVKTNGYVVIRSKITNDSELNYKLETYPPTTDIGDLMQNIASIAFKGKFGDEELFNEKFIKKIEG